MGEWRYNSTIFYFDTRWSRVVSVTPRSLYPWYPLDRRLVGPQSRPGRCGEEKNLAMQRITFKMDRPIFLDPFYDV
jgi:hypothetical protein